MPLILNKELKRLIAEFGLEAVLREIEKIVAQGKSEMGMQVDEQETEER